MSALTDKLMSLVSGGADALGNVGYALNDLGSEIRYGVPAGEKARLSLVGLPGGPDPNTTDPETLNRYGAGYLFGKNWGAHPTLAHIIQTGIADPLHLPFDPRLQEYAGKGLERGLADYQAAQPEQPDVSALVAKLQSLRDSVQSSMIK
jgi:hypothetical protein